jgi:hypothetical protein
VFVVAFQLTHLASAAEFFEIGDVVGGPGLSHERRGTLTAMSGDGSTIVGAIFDDTSVDNRSFFRWQRDTGAVELGIGGSTYAGVVHDGSAILIASVIPNVLPDRFMRITEWTEENGIHDLGIFSGPHTFRADTGNYILGGHGSSWMLWSKANGLEVADGMGGANDVSENGTVVGRGSLDNKAFVWTKQTGLLPLITEPHAISEAIRISTDGMVIGGRMFDQANGYTVFRWTQQEGLQRLGPGYFTAMSNDGSTIFGVNGAQAFRWTQATGFDLIPPLAGIQDVIGAGLGDVTRDGAMAIGSTISSSTGSHPFVWRLGKGVTTVEDMLANEFGLADRIAGWQLTGLSLSEDGKILAGTGLNPDGFRDTWVADLHLDPGDFNNDGTVDAADYVVWRNGLGATHTPADYDVWRANFGVTRNSATTQTVSGVPEPTAISLGLISATCTFAFARRAPTVRRRDLKIH